MRMRSRVITLILSVAGCTSFTSRTTLIDPDGNIYEGKAKFHWNIRDGTVEIPQSSYGSLRGRFGTRTPAVRASGAGMAAAMSGADTIVVPTLSSQSVELGNSAGSAYLAHDGKVLLRCNIGVDFKTSGWGDAKMVGGGVCADAESKTWQIMFGR
jgi:hypothetical protein